MDIQIHKFGGASVKDAEGVKRVIGIITQSKHYLGIVVSAIGKTTNALEAVVNAFVKQDGQATSLLQKIKDQHLKMAVELGITREDYLSDIMDAFVEIDWLIEDDPHDPYDYIYDQVVSVGELVSSKILAYSLIVEGIDAFWLDVRGVLFTDEIYRNAKVNWEKSVPEIQRAFNLALGEDKIIVTQGFIGSTLDNNTTTLGREGSDYTAAILSYALDADSMHIWKDVPGVLTGDPSRIENTILLPNLSYREAIELTYYGAKVIHPKTIKPLKNKSIPLYVRPFNDPSSYGTTIDEEGMTSYPPIIVIEDGQAMIQISVKDFSFVAEHHLSKIFTLLSEMRLKVNLMRNTAISFTIIVTDDGQKVKRLKDELQADFSLKVIENLELLTLRHPQESIVDSMTKDRVVLYRETLEDMVQIVCLPVQVLSRKV